MYGWGENILGQLGLGKIQTVETPRKIDLIDKPGMQEGCAKADTMFSDQIEYEYTGLPLRACYVSAGYAHTAVVTEEGRILTFGLNIYGQLGIGNTKTVFEPRMLEKDDYGNDLKKIVKSGCNTSGTFMISEDGDLYSCGSTNIGHGDHGMVKLPKKLQDKRQYSEVFCNDNAVVAFCPLRILSISPNSGPATGDTLLSIIGSALKDFPKLSVRFKIGDLERDSKAHFDPISASIFVKTPNFLDYDKDLVLPAFVSILVTFDGSYFTSYHEKFLIYPNKMKVQSIEPRNGPTTGGALMSLNINLDEIPENYLFSLTVGFQQKELAVAVSQNKKKNRKTTKTYSEPDDSKTSSVADDKSNYGFNNNQSKVLEIDHKHSSNTIIQELSNRKQEYETYYCCHGTYANGQVTCTIPQIPNFSRSKSLYNVDYAINGKQFSGFPQTYQFYEISIDRIYPNISLIEGGLRIRVFL